jgi:amino acid transporter
VNIPQSLLIVTLTSNFGTFMLYMMTNIVAIVAFHEHRSFNGFKHMVVPVFGLLANLLCMLFYRRAFLGGWNELERTLLRARDFRRLGYLRRRLLRSGQ